MSCYRPLARVRNMWLPCSHDWGEDKKQTGDGLGTGGRPQSVRPRHCRHIRPRGHIAPHVAAIATYAQHSRSARDAQSLALLYVYGIWHSGRSTEPNDAAEERGGDAGDGPELAPQHTTVSVCMSSPPVGPACASLDWLATSQPGRRSSLLASPQRLPKWLGGCGDSDVGASPWVLHRGALSTI